jgi:hypothetical protein
VNDEPDFEFSRTVMINLLLMLPAIFIQLKELRTYFKNMDSLVMFLSGIQISEGGAVYPMLQYRFKNDPDTPPKELIQVIFDDKNKILGIHPMKR